MKKSRLAVSILMASMIFAATSCHDNIYSLIEQEVPQQNGLEGDISSIVPFKGSLYTSNSRIYRKTLSPSSATGQYNYQWSRVNASSDGSSLSRVVSIAADDTYLYCYTVNIVTNKDDAVNYPQTRTVYSSTDGETWTKVTESNNKVVLFDNQVGNGKTGTSTSGRKAYLLTHEANSDGTITSTKLLQLNGIATPTDVTVTTSPSVVNSTENAKWTIARAVMLNGSEKIINTTAATVNNAGTYAYYAKGSSVACTDGSEEYTVELSSGPIWALAATNDYLLVGTTNGIYRTAIQGNKVSSSVSDFGNNAQTLLTSHINCIYVLDSSLSEAGTDEYASLSILGPLSSAADSFKETGLYAFYPGRGNWNRDGDSSKK